MESFNLMHAKALYLRFCTIYGDKFTKPYHDADFKSIWYQEWAEGLSEVDVYLIKDCLDYCRNSLEWPPSIAEFRNICEKKSGFPSSEEALALAIRREFKHPLVKLAYEKVGSWAMKHNKQLELQSKFKAAYQDALSYFRSNQQQAWLELETFNSQPKQIEPPSKIPSQSEIISFRERFKRWQKESNGAKEDLPKKEHPKWEEKKLIRGSRHFDQNYFNERKKYLLDLDEMYASCLEKTDWYDRVRFKLEIEAIVTIDSKNDEEHRENDKSSSRSYKGDKKVYDRWGD